MGEEAKKEEAKTRAKRQLATVEESEASPNPAPNLSSLVVLE